MLDPRYQRKPKKDHPWLGWQPGKFSKTDKERNRQPGQSWQEKGMKK